MCGGTCPCCPFSYAFNKLKDRLTSIIRNAFIFKNGNRRYKYLVLGHEETYFVKEHSDSKSKYSEDDIIKMLEFLVDNIFVVFAGKVFQQTVGIPMGTNCAPLLADIFLYSYEADFIQSFLSTGKKHLASRFNLTYRYIDDVLSINNPEFENYLGQMYPAELEIKDTTESTTSASYLDLLLSIGRDGQVLWSIWGSHQTLWSLPLPNVTWHSGTWPIQWHPQLIRHYTYLRIYYRTGLKYRFWPYYRILEVSIEPCNGCG